MRCSMQLIGLLSLQINCTQLQKGIYLSSLVGWKTLTAVNARSIRDEQRCNPLMQFFVLALMKRYYFLFDRLTVNEKQILLN